MPSFSKVASVLALAACAQVALSAPTPSPQFNELTDAYSGEGGTANGGSVLAPTDTSTSNSGLLGGKLKLVSLFSHNGGSAGKANSGVAITGANSTSTGTVNNLATSPAGTNVLGSAYTGKGGSATGGDVMGDAGGAIDLFTGNAGKGGDAASGGAGSNIVPISAPLSKAAVPNAGAAPVSPLPLSLLHIKRTSRMGDMD